MSEPTLPTDALSDVLDLATPRGVLLSQSEVRGTAAGVSFPETLAGAILHVVLEGRLDVRAPGERATTHAEPGDIVLLPCAAGHRVGHRGTRTFTPLEEVPERSGANGTKLVRVGVGPVTARVLSGYFLGRPGSERAIRALLPPVLHVAAARRGAALDALCAELAREHAAPSAGSRILASRALEMIVVHALRAEGRAASRPGLLRGLEDARLAPAIEAIRRDVRRAWSLDAMARVAGMSRARFAARFHEAVGITPFDFLAHWRVLAAQELLLRGDLGLDHIAERVGYTSAPVLARAFKRFVGLAPLQWRRASARIARATLPT